MRKNLEKLTTQQKGYKSMASNFATTKDILIKHLNEIKNISAGFTGDLRAEIDYEIQKLVENRFNLAVVGQFKRGKSTFINALLKSEIVPTAIVPLTSVVTLIKYGEKIKVTLDFHDGSKKEITLDTLGEYVTEKGNPHNEKGVKQVIIDHPSDFLKNGVILINTPGVGSVFQHNTDATYDFLPKLDAAIFLFTIDSPVAQNELEFLKDVSKKAVKIFFVLNKIDYADKKDINEAVDFARQILEEHLETKNIKIYPISAKTALEASLEGNKIKWDASGLQIFIDDLDEFLSEEKGDALIKSVCITALRVLSQLRFMSELELKALTTPVSDLGQKISRLKEKIRQMEEDEKDILFIFDGETKEVFAKFQRDYENFKNDNYKKLVELALRQYFDENTNLPAKELIEKSREYITEKTLNLIDTWKETELKELACLSEKITAKLAQKVESIIVDLYEGFLRIKGFKQTGYFYYNMEPEKSFFVPTPLSVAPLLPGFIARKMLINHMMRWLEQQFDRQCGRVRYDIAQKMEKTFKDYSYYLRKMLRNTKENILTSVEKAAEMKKQGETSIRKKMDELQEVSNRIRDLEIKIIEIRG